jgi:hypothetical protein
MPLILGGSGIPGLDKTDLAGAGILAWTKPVPARSPGRNQYRHARLDETSTGTLAWTKPVPARSA